MKKKLRMFSLIFVCLFSVFTLAGCGNKDNDDKDNLTIAPTQSYVIECLEKVPGVLDTQAATEITDPNNLLNKPGGYYASIYFSYSLVNQNELDGNTIIEKGVEAGGCIEVYSKKADAEKREQYLATFDGSFLATGTHKVVGTLVVRTSNELLASQQKLLESNIVAALNGNDSSINQNIGTPDFDNDNDDNNNDDSIDYESLISFPNTNDEIDVSWFVYYEPRNEDAHYSGAEISDFSYTFNDKLTTKLAITFDIDCYVWYAYQNEFAFEIVVYDLDDNHIKTQVVQDDCVEGQTTTVQPMIVLNMSDVQSGLKFEFENFSDEHYWDDKEYNEDFFGNDDDDDNDNDYESLINLPNTENGSFTLSCYDPTNGGYQLSSRITVYDISYTFDDYSEPGQLCVIYEFDAFVDTAIDDLIVFEVAIFDNNNALIRTELAFLGGTANNTLSDYAWIYLDMSEVEEGIKIVFRDYYWEE